MGPSCMLGECVQHGATNSRPLETLAQKSTGLVQKICKEIVAQWRLMYLVEDMDQANGSQGRFPEDTWAEGSGAWGQSGQKVERVTGRGQGKEGHKSL